MWNRLECFQRFIISYMLNFIAFWYRTCKLLLWVVPLKQCISMITCLMEGRICLEKKKRKKKLIVQMWVFEKRFLPYTSIFTLPSLINSPRQVKATECNQIGKQFLEPIFLINFLAFVTWSHRNSELFCENTFNVKLFSLSDTNSLIFLLLCGSWKKKIFQILILLIKKFFSWYLQIRK